MTHRFIAALILLFSTFAPAQSLAATADAPFTGTWSGSFEIHYADGRIGNETAWLVLQQSGKTVTGTAGPRPDQQQPLHAGVVAGGKLTFDADSTPGKMLKVTLRRDGDRLKGEAQGDIGNDTVRAVLDLQPIESAAQAQPPPDPLTQQMLALDTALFDSFNNCADPAQLQKHAAFFSKDVEFYHDLGGVERGADAVVESTRKNVCGKFRRKLDAETFRAYPIAGYGAVTMGTHRFCHTPTTCEGIAEFTMVWKQTGDVWQVTRALSYAHRSAN